MRNQHLFNVYNDANSLFGVNLRLLLMKYLIVQISATALCKTGGNNYKLGTEGKTLGGV